MSNNIFENNSICHYTSIQKSFCEHCKACPPPNLYSKVEITDLVDLDYLEKQQNALYEFTKMPFALVDPEGRFLSKISGDERFFQIVRESDPERWRCTPGTPPCLKSETTAGEIKELFCSRTQLTVGAAPIRIGERTVAYWRFARRTSEKVPREYFRSYAEKLNVDPEELYNSYNSLPYSSAEEFRLASALIFNLARQISEMAYLRFCLGNDRMLNIPNRAICEIELARSMRKERGGSGRGAAMFLDIDDFKKFNETFGDNPGEALIRHVYEVILKELPEAAGMYRFGGDEFFIVWDGADEVSARELAETLLARFRLPMELNGVERFYSVSIGMAIYPEHGPNVEELFKSIDLAMYRAKNSGKGQVMFFSSFEGENFKRRNDLERRLREAACNNFTDFVLYYQPLVSVDTQRWTVAEALIRWDEPELGMLYPDQFISLAEYLGVIVPMSEWVMRSACRQCVKWHEQGFKDFKISVNMSIAHLLSSGLTKKIMAILHETGLEPKYLVLEIPETIDLHKLTSISDDLDYLRNAGISISMDDFGMGCASLSNLRTMPLDFVKIDKSFMMGQPNAFLSREFLKAMVDLMHSMNIQVCAEGIEDSRWIEQLREMRFDMLQGYLFTRPMPADLFVTHMAANQGNILEALPASSPEGGMNSFDESIFDES